MRPRFGLRDLLEVPVRPQGRDEPDRDVHEEDPPPPDRGRDDPSQNEPGDSPDHDRDLVHAERAAPLVRRERVRDDRHGVREQEPGADRLHEAEDDELEPRAREPTQEGARREHGEAEDVETHPAEHVGETPEVDQYHRGEQRVADEDPEKEGRVGPRKLASDRRERDEDDVRVDRGHEGRDRRVREDEPLVLHPYPTSEERRPARLSGDEGSSPAIRRDSGRVTGVSRSRLGAGQPSGVDDDWYPAISELSLSTY